jgi:hypothetical protein
MVPATEPQCITGVQARGYLAQSNAGHTRGDDLERQGQSAEIPTDVSSRGNVLVRKREVRHPSSDAGHEQPHCLAGSNVLHVIRIRIWNRQWGHAPNEFALNAEWFTAGRQDSQARARAQQACCQVGPTSDHPLTVIEQQQELARTQPIDDGQIPILARPLADPERLGDGARHESWIGKRSQID